MVGILLKVDILLKVMYFLRIGELIDWGVLQIGECWCIGTHLFSHYNTVIVIIIIKKILLSSHPSAI